MRRALVAIGILIALPAQAAIPGEARAPKATPIAWPAGPGKILVETRCLICHNGELIASQRLTPAQWDREVGKMAGWGAPLDAAEKRVLAGYLAKAFPADAPPMKPAVVRLGGEAPTGEQ